MGGGFAVWIVKPAGDIHWQGLKEAAEGVVYGLNRLNYSAELVNYPSDARRLIIFNSHRLIDTGFKLPKDAILFNSEQVPTDTLYPRWGQYLELLKQQTVWDYSETNIERLRTHGIENVTLCRLGYYPPLTTIDPGKEDIDVLMYGSINKRRLSIVNNLTKNGLYTKILNGTYGVERDRWIARSKVVINVHFYDKPIFEIFRVSYLLANKKCVISEDGGCDPMLEGFADAVTVHVPYDEIVEVCKELVTDSERRRIRGNHGYRIFSQIDQVEEVKLALDATKMSVAA